jgi:hypothetical protein
MEDVKKEEQKEDKKKRKQKRKNKVTEKLKVLKNIIKNGTDAQKAAIEALIKDYLEYCDLPKLEEQYKALGDKIKDIKEKNAPSE